MTFLDLNSVIEDNTILLQIPMQVLTKAEQQDDATMPNGGDWNVVSEGES